MAEVFSIIAAVLSGVLVAALVFYVWGRRVERRAVDQSQRLVLAAKEELMAVREKSRFSCHDGNSAATVQPGQLKAATVKCQLEVCGGPRRRRLTSSGSEARASSWLAFGKSGAGVPRAWRHARGPSPLFRFSRKMKALWAVVLAVTPACNLVIGNEDGVLDDGDASTADPPSMDPDARAAPAPDADASAAQPEATVNDEEASTPDATNEPTEVDASGIDSDRKDSAKPHDGSDERRADADGPGSICEAGVSICAEGQVATDMQTCGPCARGVQTRTRTCAVGGCGWGDWSSWGACSVQTAECMPGQSTSEAQTCGPCNTGTQTRTRSCTASCTWGAWGAFGTCGSITAECPSAVL